MYNKVKLWDKWQFQKFSLDAVVPQDYSGNGILEEHNGLSESEDITIPHDWLIVGNGDLYENSIGLYSKTLSFSEEDLAAQDIYYLYFEGVYMDSSIFINGQEVFEWKYGYSSFFFEIQEYLKPGQNLLQVRVKHHAPNSRWYSGAGIYRPVYLLRKSRQHFVPDSLYVHSKLSWEEGKAKCAKLFVSAELKKKAALWPENQKIRYRLYNNKEHLLIEEESQSETVELSLDSPELWSPSQPNLYKLELSFYEENQLLDSFTQMIGLREIELDSSKGFFINKKRVLLKGVCLHHDLGILGAAFHRSAAKRQIEKLQEAGVNAIRFSHNMPAPAYLDLCDEMGLLVINEAFDMWKLSKTQFDYARFFEDWHAKDVKSWICRDRNHPSIIMWSVGNEIYDTHDGEHGYETLKDLLSLVQKYDPMKNAYTTFGSNFLEWEKTQECAALLDAVGYNYTERLYEEHHEKFPDWAIYGSETSSIVQSRGIYRFPLEKNHLTDVDLQCSALGNSTTSWGAPSFDYLFEMQVKNPFSLGQFIWTGIDYIGEPTPYDTKNSYFGILDTALFPKDSFYHFKAAWSEEKVLHIAPHWNHAPGEEVDVLVYSNASYVQVRRNGELVGEHTYKHEEGEFSWHVKVPFVAGVLEAVAFDDEGKEVQRVKRESFGDAKAISLKVDKESINPDELAFLEISLLDENGNIVEDANALIHFDVRGAGELLGLDNGDSADFQSYRSNERYLFNGKLLAMIQPLSFGTIEVEISSPGLETIRKKIVVQEQQVVVQDEQNTFQEQQVDDTDDQESEAKSSTAIFEYRKPSLVVKNEDFKPEGKERIRSLHFIRESWDCLEKTNPIRVYYRSFPEEMHEKEQAKIEFAITDSSGVQSDLAQITKVDEEEKFVEFNVDGDGTFLLRALVFDAFSHASFIASTRFESRAYGEVRHKPERFVYANHAEKKDGVVSMGNHGGVSFDKGEPYRITFENLSLSEEADTLYMPVFSFDKRTYFTITRTAQDQSVPEILFDQVLEKEVIWNQYQEFVFPLAKAIQDGDTLSIQMRSKGQIQGFYVKEKAVKRILLTNNDLLQIYGDQYTVEENRIGNIGNNVSLQFAQVFLGHLPHQKVRIKGYTRHNTCSIHLLVKGEKKKKYLLEFSHKDEVSWQEFPIEAVKAKVGIELIFLPGSDFDFYALEII